MLDNFRVNEVRNLPNYLNIEHLIISSFKTSSEIFLHSKIFLFGNSFLIFQIKYPTILIFTVLHVVKKIFTCTKLHNSYLILRLILI